MGRDITHDPYKKVRQDKTSITDAETEQWEEVETVLGAETETEIESEVETEIETDTDEDTRRKTQSTRHTA